MDLNALLSEKIETIFFAMTRCSLPYVVAELLCFITTQWCQAKFLKTHVLLMLLLTTIPCAWHCHWTGPSSVILLPVSCQAWNAQLCSLDKSWKREFSQKLDSRIRGNGFKISGKLIICHFSSYITLRESHFLQKLIFK